MDYYFLILTFLARRWCSVETELRVELIFLCLFLGIILVLLVIDLWLLILIFIFDKMPHMDIKTLDLNYFFCERSHEKNFTESVSPSEINWIIYSLFLIKVSKSVFKIISIWNNMHYSCISFCLHMLKEPWSWWTVQSSCCGQCRWIISSLPCRSLTSL